LNSKKPKRQGTSLLDSDYIMATAIRLENSRDQHGSQELQLTKLIAFLLKKIYCTRLATNAHTLQSLAGD